MDRYRESTSTLSTRSPALAPPSKPLGSPEPQTSLSTSTRMSSLNRTLTYLHLTVFELPDELILSILSHIAPDPQATGHCAWFRDLDPEEGRVYCDQRRQFLRRLSMTCREMRLRFVPWVWERLEISSTHYGKSEEMNIIANALYADAPPATNIRCFCALLCPRVEANPCPPKIYDGTSSVGRAHLSSIRQVLKVPPKPPYAGDAMVEKLRYDRAPDRA